MRVINFNDKKRSGYVQVEYCCAGNISRVDHNFGNHPDHWFFSHYVCTDCSKRLKEINGPSTVIPGNVNAPYLATQGGSQ